MSRIGKLPIILSEKVQAQINDHEIEVKWNLWVLKMPIHELVSVKIEDNKVIVAPKD